MFRLFRKSAFVCLLPLVVVAVVWGDAIRMQVHFAGNRAVIEPGMNAQDDSGLDQTLRAHYVRLNENGELTGVISAIDKSGVSTGVGNLEVNLVQKSRVVTRATTISDGSFLTREIPPGSYTLCVAGSDGFLAYGIQVIARESGDEEALPVPLPGEEDTAGESPEDSDADIGQTSSPARPSQPVAWRGSGGYQENVPASPIEVTAAVIPPEFSALQRIMSDYVPEGLDVSMGGSGGSRINVEESVVVGGFQVSLTAEGNLEGQIASLTSEDNEPIRLREMNAFLLLDDQIYSRVTVQEDGNFLFNDIEPGVYGFAAAGPDGFAAMSFQAVAAEEEESAIYGPDSPFRNASRERSRSSEQLKVAISPAEDLPWLRDKINELNRVPPPPAQPIAVEPPPPPPGGAFGGPGGGGFGGPGGYAGSGYGNFGEWIGAALAAWVIAEAARNRNDNVITTPPIIDPPLMSPF